MGNLEKIPLYSGVLSFVDKYIRTAGNSEVGLYCYNFCLTTDPFQYQPSGVMNMTHFKHIAFEYSTIDSPLDLSGVLLAICSPNNEFIGYNNYKWRLKKYNFDMYIMEERYNILDFKDNMVVLQFVQNY